MADIQVGAAIHINGQMETDQETTEIETEEIQEVAIEIDDQLKTTTTETSQDFRVPIDELEILMKNKVSGLPTGGGPFRQHFATIFRLPSGIHKSNKELCEPNLVAIGPYHHGKKCLRTMEEHKWYTLRNFLERNPLIRLADYLKVMRSKEEEARKHYSESVNMKSNDFVKMLLLDGCFILQFFFMNKLLEADTFFDVGWANGVLFSDMFLMENQIPFFVLHELWAIQNHGVSGNRPKCGDHCPLIEYLCPILTRWCGFTQFKSTQTSCRNLHHLLHLYHTGVVPENSQPQTPLEQKSSDADILRRFCHLASNFIWSKLYCKSVKAENSEHNNVATMNQKNTIPSITEAENSEHNNFATMNQQHTIPSITELHDAGVKFKKKKNPATMFDISFRNGTIEMPLLQIHASTIRILWNMVAFEQSLKPYGFPQTLSSYLALMDTLINTDKDVLILEQSGIFDNFFPNAEEAAAFFNQFDKYFTLCYEDHYFKGLFQDVRKYTHSTWPKYRALLMKDYFNNPWSIISVVAAGILLILTFVQTYYSAAK